MPRQARPRGPIELLLYPVVNLILLNPQCVHCRWAYSPFPECDGEKGERLFFALGGYTEYFTLPGESDIIQTMDAEETRLDIIHVLIP